MGNRFPDGPAPTRVERAPHLIFGIGRRRGGQPKRVWRFDAAEFDAEVGHNRFHDFAINIAWSPKAATFPSCTASTISPPPRMQSPPAKSLGMLVARVLES